MPNQESVKLVEIDCKDGELVAFPEHGFPVLKILDLFRCLTVLAFKEGSTTKLETLELLFDNMRMSVVGLENLKNHKEVKLHGSRSNPEVKRVVEQLKTHPKSNQIKVVADLY